LLPHQNPMSDKIPPQHVIDEQDFVPKTTVENQALLKKIKKEQLRFEAERKEWEATLEKIQQYHANLDELEKLRKHSELDVGSLTYKKNSLLQELENIQKKIEDAKRRLSQGISHVDHQIQIKKKELEALNKEIAQREKKKENFASEIKEITSKIPKLETAGEKLEKTKIGLEDDVRDLT
ncbi:MAG: hypothetical protein ACTSYC_12125, partial [Promethearchaeota archaeon]